LLYLDICRIKQRIVHRFGRRLALIVLLLGVAAPSAPAQETGSPQSQSTPTPAPGTPPQLIPPELLPPPSSSPTGNPPPVSIPEIGPRAPTAPLSPVIDEQRHHVEWRKLRNRVQNDPQIKSAQKAAERASTDLQKRQLLREYYEIFYRKMAAIASPTFRPYLEKRKAEAISTLPQPRVRPESVPPTPRPTRARTAATSASRTRGTPPPEALPGTSPSPTALPAP